MLVFVTAVDKLADCKEECLDLGDVRVSVSGEVEVGWEGIGVGHALNRNRCITADRNIADHNLFSKAALNR